VRSILLITVILLLGLAVTYAGGDSPPAIADRPRLNLTVFQFEQQAQQHCPQDAIVWAVASRGIYYVSAERWYGQTNNGAYACHRDADKAHYRANAARQ
jgi:hypothetical protein